ncbi:MAG: hypothetical protein KDD39_02660 [Bdellovibrionales bacterium]|nr:hypothetical protein [Bdellovibrionales bacterium]
MIFTTVVTGDYVPGAKVLADSLTATQEGFRFFTLAVDESALERLPKTMNPLPPSVLKRTTVSGVQYDAFELCNALRYSWIEYLFREYEPNYVVYLDSDILVLNSFSPLFEFMGKKAFCLTPHVLRPYPMDGQRPDDLNLINFGFHNSGMLAFSNSPDTMAVLTFLKERVERFCYNDPPRFFVDQKILPIATGLFWEQFCQLQHPGFNVAYWNLHERDLSERAGVLYSNDEPLVFFHFSGFDYHSPQALTRWPSRPLGKSRDIVGRLVEAYYARLLEARRQLEAE